MSQPAVESRAPTPEDLAHLAEHLRAQDQAELAAGGWSDFHRALEVSVERSRWAQVALVEGEPAAVFGCAELGTLLTPIGVPWMLGTELVPRHRRVLQRWARRYIETMLQDYPRLFNAVHARNTVAMRWLKHMGFKLHAAVQVEGGEMFHPFELRA